MSIAISRTNYTNFSKYYFPKQLLLYSALICIYMSDTCKNVGTCQHLIKNIINNADRARTCFGSRSEVSSSELAKGRNWTWKTNQTKRNEGSQEIDCVKKELLVSSYYYVSLGYDLSGSKASFVLCCLYWGQ